MKKTFKLTDLVVKAISLVRHGANGKHIVLKAEGETDPSMDRVVLIRKRDDELGVVYGIVYSPDELDAQGDFTDAGEIRKAAYRFMKDMNLRNVDKNHDEPISAYIAESWILKGNDAVFPGEKEGAWAVGIKIEDDEIRKQIQEGEIKGISMAGVGNRVETEFKKAVMDFNTMITLESLWNEISALRQSIESIMASENEGKIDAVMNSIEQFKTYLATKLEGVVAKSEELTGRLSEVEGLLKKSKQDQDVGAAVGHESEEKLGLEIAKSLRR